MNSKLHLAVDSHGMPVPMILAESTVADCTQASDLLADIATQYLLAHRSYDTNSTVAEAEYQRMEPVIPPRSPRKDPLYYDQPLYKLRDLVENALPTFRQWRLAATRNAKRSTSFPAIFQIRVSVLWTNQYGGHFLQQSPKAAS